MNEPGKFDFGLTAEQEQRATRLHSETIVWDWLWQHAGGPNIFTAYPDELQAEFRTLMASAGSGMAAYGAAVLWPYRMALEGRSDLIKDWYMQSGLTVGTYHIAVYDESDPRWAPYEAMFEELFTLPWLRKVTTAEQARQCKEDGVIGLYAHCQPISPAPRNLQAISQAYERGLRSFMLTYNRMDNIGVGCTERYDGGLSNYGIDVVRHCNEIGMIVDTSHCGHLTTMDACKFSRRPVNANHTCAKALSDVARAKTDDALKAIAGTDGVIGIVSVPFFLTKTKGASIEVMLDHVQYVSDLVGWQHVSLGTDWPLQAPEAALGQTLRAEFVEHGFKPDEIDITDRLAGFDDYRDLPNITRGLVKRGFSDEQIKGIMGENALRMFGEVCG
ncbi:dipeptidase [Sphingosinicella rhizophila]|uniref:Membrane dipeptidase n=1 Tax=Sphingosinicella rhizophila TaxID=3050082 RepID=A0ABU3Q5N0_9SPHN|nr:membrane dipeptidase [Sphingosinicella sp. GR2756]MDT9598717.1 membrane dipeptidase [Sphingosinicella sp. GR2756]